MREHEAGRPRTPGHWHTWVKRISNAAAHLSAASLLASGMASSLAARKRTHRNDGHGGRDADRDRNGGNDRNREDKQANDPKEDRRLERENRDRLQGDGDGDQGNRSGRNDRHVDAASDTKSAARQQDATDTPTPEPTSPGDGGDGGGGGGDGGNRAGNAGSGLFDNPLATKARRRANDFDNADHDRDEDGTFGDVDPDGESVYETDSVSLITGPDGLEIHTGNITYFAEPTPTPEPLPRLELPEREPGFPFGEDFPFGDAAISVGPRAAEPSDPGDTATTTDTRAKFFPTQPEPSSDGGDNTMDFTS
jgi:hypothetical protein